MTDKVLLENSPTFGKKNFKKKLNWANRKFKKHIKLSGFNKEFCTKLGIRLEIIDVGGNSKLISLWRHYITGASAVLYFIDSGDITRTKENCEHLKVFQLIFLRWEKSLD